MTASFIDVRPQVGGTEPPAWPVPHAAMQAAVRAQWRAILDFAAGADPETRRIVLLIGVRLASSAGALAEAALAVANEAAVGVVVEGPPEVAYLRDGGGVPEPSRVRTAAEVARTRNHFLRRLARIASWTPPYRLLAAWLWPSAVAVSHNATLRERVMSERRNVGFRHADAWLARIRAAIPQPATEQGLLADRLAGHMARAIVLPASLQERLLALIAAHARPLLTAAAADLAALKNARLPTQLWSGTGGQYAGRALGLELLRRHGKVERFDHGGSGAGLIDAEGMTLIEFAVTSSYTAPTPALVEPVQAQTIAPFACTVRGGAGDPAFRLKQHAQPSGDRLRVLYAPTAILGFRRVSVANIADRLYLSWQIELAAALAALPVETALRPHPEGLYRGQRHPLADHGRVDTRPFEALIPEANIFVFDFPASTTFWHAVCSDRPIVYFDFGGIPFAAALEPALRKRLRIIRVRFDAQNRPVLDRAALADAVTRAETIDSSEFRRLFAGRA